MIQTGICSYSFHRTCDKGEMDLFSYFTACRDLGCTQLDPWNKHLSGSEDQAFIGKVKAAAADVDLPFGCIAVDGAHIYEEDDAKRVSNRDAAYHWLDVAARLGAPQVRIDAGGPADMPDDVFGIIVEGYNDVIGRAKNLGIEVVVENHWGPTNNPDNVVKLLDAVDSLGLLFDTNNWIKERQREAWDMCASRARALHIKTFDIDDDGNDTTVDLKPAFELLKASGYSGAWVVESVPKDGDEMGGARKTLEMIRSWAV